MVYAVNRPSTLKPQCVCVCVKQLQVCDIDFRPHESPPLLVYSRRAGADDS